MQFVKLQLGCFLVILFIEITYLRESRREHFSYNRQFELLMLTAPFAVFFDGLTAWTVNHLDIVPGYLNRLAHLFFFIWMDFTIIITSEYMYDQLIGFHKASKKDRLLLELPGAVSLLLIIAGIGELDYIQGVTTWYSMGFSVYVCYGTVVLYYGMILFLAFTRHCFLPKEKIISTLSFILIAGAAGMLIDTSGCAMEMENSMYDTIWKRREM